MKNKKLTSSIFSKLQLLGLHCDKIPNQKISTGHDKSIVFLETYLNDEKQCLLCLSSFGMFQGVEYADPEYMIQIDKIKHTATALTFMNTFRNLESYDKAGQLHKDIEEELCKMLSDWLSELIAHVHTFVEKPLEMAM